MNELPDNSVIVMTNQNCIEFEAYTYGTHVRFYSLEIQDFMTYSPHIYNNEIIDFNKIEQDLSNENNLYLLYSSKSNIDVSFLPNKKPVYASETYTTVLSGHVEIYKVEMNDIMEISADLQSAYEE